METGGKSLGRMRHWQPVVATYRIASNTSRRYVVRGRPVLLSRGTRGVISAYSASVKSLAYLSPSRACWRRVSSVQAMGVSVQICNQTKPQPAELNQLVLNRALKLRRAQPLKIIWQTIKTVFDPRWHLWRDVD